MKKEFSVPSIDTRCLLSEGVMAEDLAVFANSPGQSMARGGVTMTDSVTKDYEAWKGFID